MSGPYICVRTQTYARQSSRGRFWRSIWHQEYEDRWHSPSTELLLCGISIGQEPSAREATAAGHGKSAGMHANHARTKGKSHREYSDENPCVNGRAAGEAATQNLRIKPHELTVEQLW
jgi:hypothetical protein